MADLKHLAVLRDGRERWDGWRLANPDIRPDISGAKLTQDGDFLPGSTLRCGHDIRPAQLALFDLSRANLSECDLLSANLRGADLTDADLRRASLVGAHLTDAALCGADLRGAVVTDERIAVAKADAATRTPHDRQR